LFINLTPQRVFDLVPPLLIKERGNLIIREASPLFDFRYSGGSNEGVLEGLRPSKEIIFPLSRGRA